MEFELAKRSELNLRERKRDNLRALTQVQKVHNETVRRLIIEDNRIDVLAELIGYRFDDFHATFIHHQLAHKSTAQFAPRGWGKSTVGTSLSAAMKILRDRNIRILFASETVTQAASYLSELKGILTHPAVYEIFGDLRGTVWHEYAIRVAGRTSTRKEDTVMTTGVDGSITGSHFDAIYGDDLVTLKNSRTEHNRNKVHQWFYTTLMPCITDEETEFHVSGTRYHPDDLYNHIMENDPRFKNSVQIVPALNPETDESNLPDIYSTEFLHELRESMGRVYFNAQMMQNPAGIQGTFFDERFFRHYEELPNNLVKFVGVDLAIGEDEEHAKFATVTIGIDRATFNIYLLRYYTERLTLDKQDAQILFEWEKISEVGGVAVGIEANAFQKSKVKSLKLQKKTAHIPAIPIYTEKDKKTRGQQLAVRYERGEIFHHKSEKGGEFEECLLNFPNAKLKDLLDAMDIAIRTALRRRKKNRSRSKKIGVISAGQNRWRH